MATSSNQGSHNLISRSALGSSGRKLRKPAVVLIAIAIAVATAWLVLISPLLLRQIARIHGVNWTMLGNVGQTYGAASALLSAIALIGVSASLVIQGRQARNERLRLV